MIFAKVFALLSMFITVNGLTCSCYAQGSGVYFSTIQQTSGSACNTDGTCQSNPGTGCFRIVGNTTYFNGSIGFCNAQFNQLASMARTIGIPMQSSCDGITPNTTGACYCDGGNLCNSQNGTVALISAWQQPVSCKCYAHGNGSYFSAYQSAYINQQCLNMGTCDAPLGTGCIRIYSNTTQFNGTMGFCGGLANQTALMASNLSVANLSSCSSANARNMGVCHCDSYNYCNVEPMLNGNGPPSWLTNTRNEVMADVETQQLLVEVVALHKAVLRLEKEKLSLEKSKLEYEITNLRAETLYK